MKTPPITHYAACRACRPERSGLLDARVRQFLPRHNAKTTLRSSCRATISTFTQTSQQPHGSNRWAPCGSVAWGVVVVNVKHALCASLLGLGIAMSGVSVTGIATANAAPAPAPTPPSAPSSGSVRMPGLGLARLPMHFAMMGARAAMVGTRAGTRQPPPNHQPAPSAAQTAAPQ